MTKPGVRSFFVQRPRRASARGDNHRAAAAQVTGPPLTCDDAPFGAVEACDHAPGKLRRMPWGDVCTCGVRMARGG